MPDDIEPAADQLDPTAAPARAAPEEGRNGNGAGTLGEPSFALDDRPPASPPAPGRNLAELEDRIRRLEEQYVALQDTKVMEERVVQRVSRRLKRGPDTQIRPAASLAADPEPPVLAPTPPPAPPPPVAKALPPEPPPPPVEAPVAKAMEVPVAKPLVGAAAEAPPPVAPSFMDKWLQPLALLEMLNELRVMLRMVGDPRYHLTWLGRLVPLVFLAVFLLSDIEYLGINKFFPWTLFPVIGWPLNKLVILILGFIAFKVLTREVRRYQQQIPDAPGARMSGLPWA